MSPLFCGLFSERIFRLCFSGQTTRQRRQDLMPLCPCALVSLCPCVLVSLCPCALVPLCSCALVPFCSCAFVPLCLFSLVPLCPCALVPLCPCALVSLCPCVFVLLCPCTFMPLCPCVLCDLEPAVLLLGFTVTVTVQRPGVSSDDQYNDLGGHILATTCLCRLGYPPPPFLCSGRISLQRQNLLLYISCLLFFSLFLLLRLPSRDSVVPVYRNV
jgi:hypothetical protein